MTDQASCPKCSGTGTISRFLDFHGGICFDCGGVGTITVAPVADLTPAEAVHAEIASLWKVIRASKNDPAARYTAQERMAQINANLQD